MELALSDMAFRFALELQGMGVDISHMTDAVYPPDEYLLIAAYYICNFEGYTSCLDARLAGSNLSFYCRSYPINDEHPATKVGDLFQCSFEDSVDLQHPAIDRQTMRKVTRNVVQSLFKAHQTRMRLQAGYQEY